MDEKKVYSVIGKVEIGTDEYRDLIEDKITAEKQSDYYRDKYWAEQTKVKELENKLGIMSKKVQNLETFIKKNSAIISEDNITLFMSAIGEE